MNRENLTFHYLTTEAELKEFWILRDRYMVEDIIPNDNPPTTDEEKDWFFSKEYRGHMESLFWREENPLRIAWLLQDSAYAGFISYIIYGNEDGKCFIVEYCVEKSRRGNGLGARFFQAFEGEARFRGAAYLALNASNDRNRKFWMGQGFVKGEPDEYGNPIYFKGRYRRKPKVIVLNGPSSSGKSTLSSALRAALELEGQRYEALSIDDYLPMVMGKVIYEEAVFESCQGLADAAAQIAGKGVSVIIDHVITSPRVFLQLTEALTFCDIYLIQVECPVEELRRRERERGNRNPGSAEASLEYLYPRNTYDTVVDTAALSEAECVNRLLALLQQKPAAIHRANRNARDDT